MQICVLFKLGLMQVRSLPVQCSGSVGDETKGESDVCAKANTT